MCNVNVFIVLCLVHIHFDANVFGSSTKVHYSIWRIFFFNKYCTLNFVRAWCRRALLFPQWGNLKCCLHCVFAVSWYVGECESQWLCGKKDMFLLHRRHQASEVNEVREKSDARPYWCVAVHVACHVDRRQALLRVAVAQAAHQAPGTLAAFGLRVVKCYLRTQTSTCTQTAKIFRWLVRMKPNTFENLFSNQSLTAVGFYWSPLTILVGGVGVGEVSLFNFITSMIWDGTK